MAVQSGTCLIWNHEASVSIQANPPMYVAIESDRAGGGYRLGLDERFHVDALSVEEKARLTTWLIDQRRQGEHQPEITAAAVAHAKSKRPLLAHERADRLLQFIARSVNSIADYIRIPEDKCGGALAWSESTKYQEVYFLLRYLDKNGWLEKGTLQKNMFAGGVSIEGYRRVADRYTNVDHSQAFVAMWFDETMDRALVQGFEPGIRDAGYRPFVINRKEHVNKIEDEIEAEIRRSRFLLADFTYGRRGAREAFTTRQDLPRDWACL